MDISISTIVTTSIVGSFLLLLFCLAMGKGKVISKVGPGFVVTIWLLVSVRMFFPIEWGYTYSFYFERVFTGIQEFFTCEIFKGEQSIAVWQICLAVWILGAVFLGFCKIKDYKRSLRLFRVLPEIPRNSLAAIWEEDFIKQYPEIQELKFVKFNHTVSPFLAGLRQPVIVMPDRKFTGQELRCVVGHEVLHYRSHDIFWKIFTEVLCTVFWWNPVFLFMKKRLFHMIEIKNDRKLTEAMTVKEKSDYLDCLFGIVKDSCGNSFTGTAGFSKTDKKVLRQRVELIAAPGKISRGCQVVTGIIVAVLLFLSTAVVFEPTYSVPDTPGSGLELTEDTGYLIENGKVYDVYILGQYIYTTEENENMHPYRGLEKYKTVEEAQEKERKQYENYEKYKNRFYDTID
ncbi:MAG: M56 family metallopeptidase [Clostridiales bacterium]|nr:M56 family metallopeptidase [Clostridiales bacterium]